MNDDELAAIKERAEVADKGGFLPAIAGREWLALVAALAEARDPGWTPRERAALDGFDALQLRVYAGDLQSALRRRDAALAEAHRKLADVEAAVSEVRAMHPPTTVDRKLAALGHFLASSRSAATEEQRPREEVTWQDVIFGRSR